jgi:hypothetical protein
MNTKSGEVLIAGALIGLVCGLIGMWVDASGRAQAKANLSGMEVSVMDEVAEEPGRAAIWTLGGAGAGAGVGALVDGLQGGQRQKERLLRPHRGWGRRAVHRPRR